MRLITTTLFFLSASSGVPAADYRFVTIDVPHATYTSTRGINARGDIVGSFADAGGTVHGFRLHQGVFTQLDIPNAVETNGRAINARGEIIGNILDADGVVHGFLLRDGQFTLVDYPGASSTAARWISDVGDITGRHIDDQGTESGFIQRDGVFYDIRFPGGQSDVWAVQNNGQVMIGDAGLPMDDFALHGFFRNRSGVFRLLDFPGLTVPCTGPRAMNERGEIVGWFSDDITSEDDCGNLRHGFELSKGHYTRVDFPGAVSTQMLGLSNDGVIVGDYDDASGQTHGFKAIPKGAE